MPDYGNKALNLRRLFDAGIPVPRFISLPSVTQESELNATVSSELLGVQLLAVRSSAAVEDGSAKSFAGAFRSEVAVKPRDVNEAWTLVKDSLPEGKNGIIVQEMVFGEYSGVCFSDFPTQRSIINALPGLCKAVVEGFDSDQYEEERNEITFKQIPEDRQCLFYQDDALIQSSSNDELTESDVLKVAAACRQCAELMQSPQDVEWTIKDGEVIILQSRPITADPWKERDVKLFDSANVGESYGGIVLPLTLSFARKLYSQVYTDLLFHSGVSKKVLKREAGTFDHLVDSAYGRMYYRMENWYRFMSLLPGYSRNKKNLEDMLMLNIREAQREVAKPSPLLKLIYYPLVFFKLAKFNLTMRNFGVEVRALLNESQTWGIAELTQTQILEKLDFLFEGILRKWYLTVENDTVMMTLFARLSSPQSKVSREQLLAFHSVSTEQVEALAKLSKLLLDRENLKQALENSDKETFDKELSDHSGLANKYRDYILNYGGRFANELKLETPDLEDNFSQFAKAILQFDKWRPTENSTSEFPKGKALKIFHRFAERREVFRLYRANMFALVRKLVWRLGELETEGGALQKADDIFYLDWEDLERVDAKFKSKIQSRRAEYKHFQNVDPPAFFKVMNGRWPSINSLTDMEERMTGIAASAGKVSDRATVLEHFDIPEKEDIGILVTKRTDPGWTTLMALSKGLVVEHGGMLSHASIVARELGLPAVIGLKDACKKIKTGQLIMLDGDEGIVTKLEEDGSDI